MERDFYENIIHLNKRVEDENRARNHKRMLNKKDLELQQQQKLV